MSTQYEPPRQPVAGDPGPQPTDASVGELFGEISKDLSTLIRQEIALAKAETAQSAKQAGKGAGMLGGAAWSSHFVLLFLSLALWWALGALLGTGDNPALGWAALIVAIIWAVIALILASMGRRQLRRTQGLPQTADTVKKIPDALKGQERS
jgi:hypothetical protein